MKKLYLPIILLIMSVAVGQIKSGSADGVNLLAQFDRKNARPNWTAEQAALWEQILEEKEKLIKSKGLIEERLEKIEEAINQARKINDLKALDEAMTDKSALQKSIDIINNSGIELFHKVLLSGLLT